MNKYIGKLEKISPVCFQHDFTFHTYEDTFRFGVFGDPHIDAIGHATEFFIETLSKCAETNTPCILIGDIFDAMQGKNDRRSSKQAMTMDDIGSDPYFNNIVDKVADTLAPYMKKIPWVLSLKGNHETAVEKHNEIDLMQLLKYSLYQKGFDNFQYTGYRTYLKSRFLRKDGQYRFNMIGGFHHGWGGARRSKGTLQIDINKGMYGSIDYFCTGHTHEQWSYPAQVLMLDKSGNEYKKEVLFLQVPSFKEDIVNVHSGFAIERSFQPLPLGGYWLDISLYRERPYKKIEREGFRLRETRM